MTAQGAPIAVQGAPPAAPSAPTAAKVAPSSTALSPYQRYALRRFGRYASRDVERNTRLSSALLRAGHPIRPEAYLSQTYLTMAIALAGAVVLLGVAIALKASGLLPIPTMAFVVVGAVVFFLPIGIYVFADSLPQSQAKARAKRIDAQTSYALSYMASLASAGVPPARIFSSLADQKVFGEVAREAEFITRDLNVLGKDLISALSDAKDRSPSLRFQDFLQGCVSALTSGVDVKDYFTVKADQYFAENRLAQKMATDNLGILAESFVTVVVAGPTFLIVLISIMSNVGSGAGNGLFFGYLIVLVMLPLAQFGFAVALASSAPEG